MQDGLVSVVIPVFNREQTIARSVNSVLQQTYSNIEVIIVDDHSSDKTLHILNQLTDSRIRVIALPENVGACAARNVGVESAIGDYIAFQDSDDEWMPEKLSREMDYLKETGSDVVFCSLVLKEGRHSKTVPSRRFEFPKKRNEITLSLLCENYISTQTILGKRYVFDDVKFDERFPRFQDWDLAVEISKTYDIAYLDVPLVIVHRMRDSISNNQRAGIAALELLRKKNQEYYDSSAVFQYYFARRMLLLRTYVGEDTLNDMQFLLSKRFDLKLLIVFLLQKVGHINWLLAYKKTPN